MSHDLPQLSESQRARMEQRLGFNPDRSDSGQWLELTRKAWDLPHSNAHEGALRVAGLVDALLNERLVVAVPVEAHPEDPEHEPREQGRALIELVDGPYGTSMVAFTAGEELAKWDPNARPMTLSSSRAAVAALASASSGTITLNPASPLRTLIPRAAVLALSASGAWLPAWADPSLRSELLEAGRCAFPAICGLNVVPAEPYGPSAWDGAVAIEVLIDVASVKASDYAADYMPALTRALKELGRNARLRESAMSVQIVPKPVHIA